MSLQLQHTNNSKSLKLGCALELIYILEQGAWGHICTPFEAIESSIDILLSSIFVVLYANNYV